MAEIRHLKNAPITEAIIDFRVQPASDFQAEKFLELKKTIGKRFPESEERRIYKGFVEFKNGKPKSKIPEYQGIQGYFFKPKDEKKVAQFRIDGFTFSRLKPYTDWDELFDEAKELWQIFFDIAQPEAITRLAVRYINHLDLPLPITNLSKYLTAPPKIPEDIPGAISGFLSKIVVSDQEQDITTNIIQALEKSTKPDKLITIILDIDAFKIGDFRNRNSEMWEIFKELHNIKNQIFFKSITEETARLFE